MENKKIIKSFILNGKENVTLSYSDAKEIKLLQNINYSVESFKDKNLKEIILYFVNNNYNLFSIEYEPIQDEKLSNYDDGEKLLSLTKAIDKLNLVIESLSNRIDNKQSDNDITNRSQINKEKKYKNVVEDLTYMPEFDIIESNKVGVESNKEILKEYLQDNEISL